MQETVLRRARLLAAIALGALVAAAMALVGRLELLVASPLAALPDPTIETAMLDATLGRFRLDRLVTIAIRFRSGVFDARSLEALERIGKEARRIPGVVGVQSIVETSDLVASDAGLEALDLATAYPRDAAGLAAMRAHVLGHPLMAGSLVSRDGRAALVLVRLGPAGGGDAGTVAALEETVRASVGDAEVELGGQPWVVETAVRAARRDGVGLAILLVIAMGSLAVATGLRHGGRAAASLVASVAAIVLVGLGGRGMSDRDVGELELLAAIALLLAAAVAGAAVVPPRGPLPLRTAAASMVACVAIGFLAKLPGPDVSKLRIAAAAAAAAGLLALVARHGLREGTLPGAGAAMAGIGALLAAGAMLGLGAASPAGLPGPPEPGPSILAESFEQAGVLLVRVHGDVTDPVVVDRIGRLEDALARVPGVSRVTGIASVVRFLGSLLGDGWRTPLDRGKLGNVYFFLEGTPDAALLVSHDNAEALVTVSLAPGYPSQAIGEVRRLAGAIEPVAWIDASNASPGSTDELRRADLARRVGTILGRADADVAGVLDASAREIGAEPALPVDLASEIEGLGVDAELAARIAAERGGAALDAVVEPELRGEVALLLASATARAHAEAWADSAAAALGAPPDRAAALRGALLGTGDELLVLGDDVRQLPGISPSSSGVRAHATGEPVIEEVVGVELRRMTVTEGRGALVIALLAGLASGASLAAAPPAAYLALRALTALSLADAVLLPLPVCLSIALCLGAGDRDASRAQGLAALVLGVATGAAGLLAGAPLLREALSGMSVALLATAVAAWLEAARLAPRG